METALDDPYPSIILLAISQLPITFYLVNGIGILILLFLSGLISGSEVAFFSLSHDQIQDAKTSPNKSDEFISRLVLDPKRLLATILILNNLVNIFIVTISTFATWKVVGSKDAGGAVIVILTVSITVLIIFFGEIVPKVYANHNSVSFARFAAPLLIAADRVLRPISWFLMALSNVIERRIEKKGYNLSVDEINHALEITAEKEATEEEKDMLKGIVNFSTLSVKQIMKSRIDITAIDVETDFHDLMDKVNKTGYSRIPIYNETVDKIEGILYIKDLLPHLDKSEQFKWQTLLRPGFFVPESKKIDDLFRDFQEKQVHMAIVVDEYGGTSGLITMEDVIEEIVGEINDEFDEDSDIAYNKLDPNTYVFEGKTSLNDFCKITSEDPALFDEVKRESESLGGLLLELNTKLPHAGEKIQFNHILFTVVAVDQRRIKRVRVFINPEKVGQAKEFED
ncbi:gliding motility-associated protein GldE [Marinoscillum furvescens]|uniref:Gliding motility-associated protein GldE n=1 Tax=Marinoscillum furvescens DSM 4134 TaxID=1122208 RepID=A0A3D9L5T3_MARFU|nr:gliding motility-associated protein GldE [Marinoscillum furvescens]RED98963.1 gliding motility-associated protein GldE [Marinoscillum furvescens DSM 4134]